MEETKLKIIEKLETKICEQIEKVVDGNDPDLAYKYASLLSILE